MYYFQGAFWGMVLGQTCGLVRLVLDFVYPAPSCDETDTRPSIVANVNFTYFSAILIVLSAFLAVIISLCTPKPTPEMVSLQSVRFQYQCKELDVLRSYIHVLIFSRPKVFYFEYICRCYLLPRIQNNNIGSEVLQKWRMHPLSKAENKFILKQTRKQLKKLADTLRLYYNWELTNLEIIHKKLHYSLIKRLF